VAYPAHLSVLLSQLLAINTISGVAAEIDEGVVVDKAT